VPSIRFYQVSQTTKMSGNWWTVLARYQLINIQVSLIIQRLTSMKKFENSWCKKKYFHIVVRVMLARMTWMEYFFQSVRERIMWIAVEEPGDKNLKKKKRRRRRTGCLSSDRHCLGTGCRRKFPGHSSTRTCRYLALNCMSFAVGIINYWRWHRSQKWWPFTCKTRWADRPEALSSASQ